LDRIGREEVTGAMIRTSRPSNAAVTNSELAVLLRASPT